MTKTNIVVISDIHIGTNYKTCWYQKDVHEPYLLAILEWVIEHADTIDRLVLLGDLVDFWTYPAEQKPPTFDDIVKANPTILARGGAIAKVLEVLEGRVSYMAGNHDMMVTEADLAQISATGKYKIQFWDYGFAEPDGPDGEESGIMFSHGHYFTLFNAPDPTTKWAPMPVGHFVTRMVASQWERQLKPGQTVADLPGQGAPMGKSLKPFLKDVLKHPLTHLGDSARITGLMLDWIAKTTGWPADGQFVLAHGSKTTTTTLTEVKAVYAHLWNTWVTNHGFEATGASAIAAGELAAFKAAWADALSGYLGWYAQERLFASMNQANKSALMVMGHTHVPISGLNGSLVNYINTGFECPSIPDMAIQPMSFGVIDIPTRSPTLLQAKDGPGGDIVIEPCPAARDNVVPHGFDYSCYVILENTQGDVTYETGNATAQVGFLVNQPPDRLEPGQQSIMWVQDFPGPRGSECSIEVWSQEKSWTLSVDCPTGVLRNKISGSPNFVAKTGDPNGPWGPPGHVPSWGHPLIVKFIF